MKLSSLFFWRKPVPAVPAPVQPTKETSTTVLGLIKSLETEVDQWTYSKPRVVLSDTTVRYYKQDLLPFYRHNSSDVTLFCNTLADPTYVYIPATEEPPTQVSLDHDEQQLLRDALKQWNLRNASRLWEPKFAYFEALVAPTPSVTPAVPPTS